MVVLILKENSEKAFINAIENIIRKLVPWRSTNDQSAAKVLRNGLSQHFFHETCESE